jgi:hypothetical protein
MHIRAQNAGLIVRRPANADFVQFEVFEVLPLIHAVIDAGGKLLCSYPGPAIQIPADIFVDECFLRELSSFLVQMDADFPPATNSTHLSVYHSNNPRYMSELLIGILRGYGQPAVVDHITKRIGDGLLMDYSDHALSRSLVSTPVWRRSPLWLTLRVSLQSSLLASNLYKPFILFFYAHLLCTCIRRDFPSELLYVMRAKMARRLSKLDPAVSRNVHQFVHDVAMATETRLSKRWIAYQDIGSISPTMRLKGLDFVADSQLSLDNSYEHLTKMLCLASPSLEFTQNRFTPSHIFRLDNVHDFTQFGNDQLAMAISEDPHTAILDFESSVQKNLESWITASRSNIHSLDVIASCIEQYYSGAKNFYGTNPENNSMMILTIMDLWVALDRIAIQECPLLKEYSPEIPSTFLHCLLLHQSSTLKRASYIEEYLCRRGKEAFDVPPILSNRIDDSCFAVKYFRTSESLQRLYHKIDSHSRKERTAKREELSSLNQQSKLLLNRASKMDHKHSKHSVDTSGQEYSAACQRCKLDHQVRALAIKVHQWPLPISTMHAQLTVFELSPPRAFSAWRHITYMILNDIGRTSGTFVGRPKVLLDSFSDLQGWAVPHKPYSRLTIASNSDSLSDKMVAIPAEESSVFVDNELSFGLYDCKDGLWVIEPFYAPSPSKLCDPPIAKSGPYRHLHHFVCGTKHTPNNIIAAQADCPDEINLHEFLAFSGLRSGPRLQWLNLTRELASPFLSFRREEVHTLITQVAWQLGPLADSVREWHLDLSISSFGNALVQELECLLENIKANWLEEVTARTIGAPINLTPFLSNYLLALICGRILASTIDPDISLRTCALLRETRNVTHRWIGEISAKFASMQDETSRAGLRHRLCMLAATCFSTFDVPAEHMPVILASEEDISIAMQCAVIVHDDTPSSLSNGDSLYLTRMLNRYRRILHDMEPIFRESSQGVVSEARLLHSAAYDHALAQLWQGYHERQFSSWHALPRPNSRWITCMTERGQEVHYDVLTGELLIGGKKLGRLPQDIIEHPLYSSIFGTVSDGY